MKSDMKKTIVLLMLLGVAIAGMAGNPVKLVKGEKDVFFTEAT